MRNEFYLNLESIKEGDVFDLNQSIDHLLFNDDGLIPVITQCVDTKDVLMMAWMNRETLLTTIATKVMTYWSRSRNKPWIKGETSGHVQEVQALYFDCDGDSVLCLVKQTGSACHTYRPSCFYLQVDLDQQKLLLKQD